MVEECDAIQTLFYNHWFRVKYFIECIYEQHDQFEAISSFGI